MTAKRDFKKRVRRRQAQTGESYTAARARVLAERPEPGPSAVPVLELIDVTEAAAVLGLRCRVTMATPLARRIGAATALGRLRDAMLATQDDPSLIVLRRALLAGEPPFDGPPSLRTYHHVARFVARVKAGIGGVSEGGRMLAIAIGGELVVCALSILPRQEPGSPPHVSLTTVDDLLGGIVSYVPR